MCIMRRILGLGTWGATQRGLWELKKGGIGLGILGLLKMMGLLGEVPRWGSKATACVESFTCRWFTV